MKYDQITAQAELFFEWDSHHREFVTYTSALMFARHCVENADYLSQLHVLCSELGVGPSEISERLFEAIEKVRHLKEIEATAINLCDVRGRHHSEIAMNRLMKVCGR